MTENESMIRVLKPQGWSGVCKEHTAPCGQPGGPAISEREPLCSLCTGEPCHPESRSVI